MQEHNSHEWEPMVYVDVAVGREGWGRNSRREEGRDDDGVIVVEAKRRKGED